MWYLLAPLALLGPETPAQTDLDALKQHSRVTPVVEVYRAVSPSVVYIQTQSTVHGRSILGNRPLVQRASGSGTGVVIHEDGYLVTNYHVVREADPGQIQVSFVDDPTPYHAELLSWKEHDDLALLHITGPMQPFAPVPNQPAGQSARLKRDGDQAGPRTKFPTVRMGTSADLMPGETVIAIGNPHGQTHTVSQGIISGLHRNVDIGGRFGLSFSNLIQTDASINLGNSGGPLLNVHGEMIGINSVMNTDAENIGYAIPVDRVREVLTQQLFPSAQSAWTGFDLEEGPEARVARVWPGSPAAQAGICQGDRILRIAGKNLVDEASRLNAGLHVAPYRNTEYLVETARGERISKQITPWDRANGILYEQLGSTFQEVKTGVETMVLVDRLNPEGPAAELGLQKGDWIRDTLFSLSRGDERVLRIQDIDDLVRLVGALPAGGAIDFELYRDLNSDSVFTRDERHVGRLTLP